MLEKCRDISECESILQQHLPSVRLLGQIPLMKSDIERMFTYMRRNPGGRGGEDLSDVIEGAPTTLACYLVWKGIQDYDEGTYWRSLSSELGPLDTNQQARLGRFFREFIERNGLLSVEIPGSQKNITPILLHGIIPGTMVAQFFDQIVYPLARKELVNPGSREELAFWLASKREVAKRAGYLEFQRNEIQRKLKRVEDAEKAIAGLNPAQIEHEIQQIEDQIGQEEADLSTLQAELNAIQYNPTSLTNIENDLKTLQCQEEEYRQSLSELADQRHALDEMHREFQRYSSLGIDDPLAINDFDAFRHATYTAIIETIMAALEDPEEPRRSGAQDLLTALCHSVAEGDIALPDDLVAQLETLRSTYGTGETDPGLLGGIDGQFCSEEKGTSAPPDPEPVSDSEVDVIDYNDELPPSHDGETVPASGDPEITSAHARASDVMASSPGLALERNSPDEDPTPLSRYIELHGMYLPDDLPDDPDPGVGTLNQEVGELEVTAGHPMDDPIPEPRDPTLESRECTGPEHLLPPAEDTRPAGDHDARQEVTADTDTPATFDGNASSHPCQQEVPRAPPVELEVQTPLEPEDPLSPLEPEPLTRYAEDALQPMGRLRKRAPQTATLRSRGQYSLQAGSQITEIILTLIEVTIDNLSQFLRNLRR